MLVSRLMAEPCVEIVVSATSVAVRSAFGLREAAAIGLVAKE